MMNFEMIKFAYIIGIILLIIWRGKRGYQVGILHELEVFISIITAIMTLGMGAMIYVSFQNKEIGTLIACVIGIVVVCIAHKVIKLLLGPINGIAKISIIQFFNKLLGGFLGVIEAIAILYAINWVLQYLGYPTLL